MTIILATTRLEPETTKKTNFLILSYIYIYRERERERERFIALRDQLNKHNYQCDQFLKLML